MDAVRIFSNPNPNPKSRAMQTKSKSKNTSSKEAPTMVRHASSMESSQLMSLFVDELKDIYWAEKALTKAIPKMLKNATSPELIDALTAHAQETSEHVGRCEKVFEVIGKPAVAKKCEAMAGLMKEAEEIMADCEKGAMRDAGIISAAQKIEHYEIATYGTLRQFAETLGQDQIVVLLELNLEDEKAADKKLSEVAMAAINIHAAEEEVTS
jgi:ferritin-like metal-binding protein YciE